MAEPNNSRDVFSVPAEELEMPFSILDTDLYKVGSPFPLATEPLLLSATTLLFLLLGIMRLSLPAALDHAHTSSRCKTPCCSTSTMRAW